MKIVVCVKYVPDTAIKVKIAAQAAEVDLAEVSSSSIPTMNSPWKRPCS